MGTSTRSRTRTRSRLLDRNASAGQQLNTAGEFCNETFVRMQQLHKINSDIRTELRAPWLARECWAWAGIMVGCGICGHQQSRSRKAIVTVGQANDRHDGIIKPSQRSTSFPSCRCATMVCVGYTDSIAWVHSAEAKVRKETAERDVLQQKLWGEDANVRSITLFSIY